MYSKKRVHSDFVAQIYCKTEPNVYMTFADLIFGSFQCKAPRCTDASYPLGEISTTARLDKTCAMPWMIIRMLPQVGRPNMLYQHWWLKATWGNWGNPMNMYTYKYLTTFSTLASSLATPAMHKTGVLKHNLLFFVASNAVASIHINPHQSSEAPPLAPHSQVTAESIEPTVLTNSPGLGWLWAMAPTMAPMAPTMAPPVQPRCIVDDQELKTIVQR